MAKNFEEKASAATKTASATGAAAVAGEGSGGKNLKGNKNSKKQVMSTPWRMAMKRLKRNKLAIAGLIFLVLMILVCFIGPLFSPYSMNDVDMAAAKQPPSAQHWLGTDDNGRDVLTRLLYGGQISMTVGLAATALEILIGAILGCVAAYYGGAVDFVIMRIVDVILSLPTMPILIMLSALMSDWKVDPSVRVYYLMVILASLGWAGTCRFVRGQVLTVREMDYMSAAESLGIRDYRKIFKHIMPNVIPLIIVMATLAIGDTIIMESTMSFLGVGVLPPMASWGQMVSDGNNLMIFKLRPWLWMPAGFCILLTVLSVNLVGDGLRDALDPKMKR